MSGIHHANLFQDVVRWANECKGQPVLHPESYCSFDSCAHEGTLAGAAFLQQFATEAAPVKIPLIYVCIKGSETIKLKGCPTSRALYGCQLASAARVTEFEYMKFSSANMKNSVYHFRASMHFLNEQHADYPTLYPGS